MQSSTEKSKCYKTVQNINRIKKLPKIKGVKEILYPGQSKFKRYKKNKNKKIKISPNILKDLKKLNAQ